MNEPHDLLTTEIALILRAQSPRRATGYASGLIAAGFDVVTVQRAR